MGEMMNFVREGLGCASADIFNWYDLHILTPIQTDTLFYTAVAPIGQCSSEGRLDFTGNVPLGISA